MVPLSEVVTLDRKGVHPSEVSPETPYIGLEHIERGGRILPHPQVGDIDLKSSKFYFFPEHILYGKLRPNLGKISRPDFAGICSTDILPLRPHAELDRGYLAHYLSQPEMIRYATSRTTGVNLPRLSPSSLAKFPIPLPPLGEQRRIAAILDQADAIRVKRQQQLESYNSLVESLFHSMFSQERADVTVGEIASDARSSIRTGPFGSQLRHSEFVGTGAAVLGLDNVVGNSFRWGERRYITHEKYETLKRYTVHPGDVLISIMGTVGRCAVVPQDIPLAINTKHICAITPNQNIINPSFLRAAFLWHPVCRTHLRRQTKGAIMAGLNMGIIKSMPVPLPALERQNEFAKVSFAIKTQRHHLQRALDRDNELFASLQSRAFRGEL